MPFVKHIGITLHDCGRADGVVLKLASKDAYRPCSGCKAITPCDDVKRPLVLIVMAHERHAPWLMQCVVPQGHFDWVLCEWHTTDYLPLMSCNKYVARCS